MTTTITYEPSARRSAALRAACDTHNRNNRSSLSPEEFLTMRLDQELDGYAITLAVGLVPPVEFQERFQRLGVYDRIFQLARTDEAVARYLAALRAKRDDVNLFSPTVSAGLAYLQQLGVLTAEQAAWICSLEVPAPAETMPQPAAAPLP